MDVDKTIDVERQQTEKKNVTKVTWKHHEYIYFDNHCDTFSIFGEKKTGSKISQMLLWLKHQMLNICLRDNMSNTLR